MKQKNLSNIKPASDLRFTLFITGFISLSGSMTMEKLYPNSFVCEWSFIPALIGMFLIILGTYWNVFLYEVKVKQ